MLTLIQSLWDYSGKILHTLNDVSPFLGYLNADCHMHCPHVEDSNSGVNLALVSVVC